MPATSNNRGFCMFLQYFEGVQSSGEIQEALAGFKSYGLDRFLKKLPYWHYKEVHDLSSLQNIILVMK